MWSRQIELTEASEQLCGKLLQSPAAGAARFLRTLRDLDVRDRARLLKIRDALPPSAGEPT